MDSSDNLWDSIASMNVDQQGKTNASNTTTGWGIGAALTKLRGSTTTNTNSTHGGLPISNTPPTSKSSHGGGGGGGITNNNNTSSKQKLNTKTLYCQNQTGGGGMASALWRLGGRDENNDSKQKNGIKKKVEDEEQSMGSFWNNLKKNHESEDEASLNLGGNLLHDESDYDTDKEQDKAWHPAKKRDQEQQQGGLLGRDDDANGADALEPDLLLPISKKPPQTGLKQARQTKSSSFNKGNDDDDDDDGGGSDADSDADPRHAAEDQDSGKFGLGAFLDMGKEAALEEELKAYMNPDPDDKSIADMSLISASITPAEQQRLLLQRMDMSFGKSVTTMTLDPKEAATKELRPWRQQKHLRRGSALGAMPPGTMAMLGKLAKDDDDSGEEDEEEEDPLYAIPAEFEGALDRHIPKGNFDDMWKDGAATVCSGDMMGDIPYEGKGDDIIPNHMAKKVQDKLDVEDRTSLFPDADGEVYTVAQQKIRDDIAALIQPPQVEQLSLESSHSDSRKTRPLSRRASNVSKSSANGDSTGRRRNSEEHRRSRRKSSPGHVTDGDTAREERKSRRKSSHRHKDEDSEKGSRRSDRGEHRSRRKAASDGEEPDMQDSRSRRNKSSRPSRDEIRKPSGEDDERERRRHQSNRPHRHRDDVGGLLEDKERRRRRSSRTRRDGDGEFDDSRRRDEKERRSHRSSRHSSGKRGGEPEDDCIDKSSQDKRSSRRENDTSEKLDKSRKKASARRNDDESDEKKQSRRSRNASPPTSQADGEVTHSSKEVKSSRAKQVGYDAEQKKARSLAIEREPVDEEQIRKSELKSWRNPSPHASRKNSLGDTDKHENTALKRLEERSRAAAASSSLEQKPKSTLVTKTSDVSRQGSASTGTGATAETAASLGPEENDYTEPLGRPKRKSFLSSLGLKKNVHAKLEDNDQGRPGLLADARAPRRRGSSNEPKVSGPARRRGSNEKPSVLGVALRRNSIEGEGNAAEKRGLLSEESRSPTGWGSIDEDDLDEAKKERRKRSTSVPKVTNQDTLRGERLRGTSVPRQTEVVVTEGDSESKKKKSSASHNRRSVDDEPSHHKTRKSSTKPSRSAGSGSPRMRNTDDMLETLDNRASQKKEESDRRKKSRRPPSH